MPDSLETRLAVLAERVADLGKDVAELAKVRGEDHHRLRSVEAAVKGFIDAQQAARTAEQRQYQRLGARLTLIGVLLTAAAVLSPIVVAVVVNR